SRFLEPACGSGNFIVKVLRRKLAAVEGKFGKSDFEKRHYALFGLMCIYGVELLEDNIAECRVNMLDIFADDLNLEESDDLYRAAAYVLSQNLVHGDARTMCASGGEPITFAEWGYLGKGKFQRRDFRFDTLTGMSKHTEQGSLFAKHEIFTPTPKTYPPLTVSELAALEGG
ncbi:MAG: SAM-dependent DNA methyltransferase, partial [Gammaproteobacteria bacterium]|nr:SAM-dependent DNA methyltransferase [Gammaproteobacteria bacterium]